MYAAELGLGFFWRDDNSSNLMSMINKNKNKKSLAPFNGYCSRTYVEATQNLDDLEYHELNPQFEEPQYIESCPEPKLKLKDAYKVTWPHVVKLNSDYFRWEEFQKKGFTQYSIVIVGDSMTFGVGMPITKTYPYLLQQYLNRSPNRDFKIYSLALTGGTP